MLGQCNCAEPWLTLVFFECMRYYAQHEKEVAAQVLKFLDLGRHFAY